MAVKLLGDLSASGNATFNSEVNLPSGGQIDWANGDARIIEGAVTNYSLSLQTYTGSALTTKMFIASGGNVGIGTTSPNQLLHVNGNLRIGPYYSDNDRDGFLFTPGGVLNTIQANNENTNFDNNQGNIHIRTGNNSSASPTERISVLSTGNVGIGTTAPLEKLHVAGKINSSNNIVSNSTYTMFTGRSSRTVDDYGGLNKEYFKANLVTPGSSTTGESSAHGIADLRFQLASSAGNTGMSDIMTLRSGGNVGIGTTTPGYKLEVQGDFYVNGTNGAFTTASAQSNLYMLSLTRTTTSLITAGNVGIGTENPGQKLDVDGNINSTGWIAANNYVSTPLFYNSGNHNTLNKTGTAWISWATRNTSGTETVINLSSIGTFSSSGTVTLSNYGAGILKTNANGNVSLDTNTYVIDSAPAAPTDLSLSVVNDTVNITFAASATSGIDSYFVFSSVAGGDYSLISMIAPDDFGATMSIIDNAFDATGTQAYRVYAVKNGIISADLTGSISYSVTSPLEPTNMSVVNLNTAFYVQWDAPSANARFVTAYNVYKHEHATESSLARSSATLIYSGNNYSYMYQISGNDNNNFHKFWVETTVV